MKFQTTIGRSTVVGQTQKAGSTLFQTHANHKITLEYLDLAHELLARLQMLKEGREQDNNNMEVANG